MSNSAFSLLGQVKNAVYDPNLVVHPMTLLRPSSRAEAADWAHNPSHRQYAPGAPIPLRPSSRAEAADWAHNPSHRQYLTMPGPPVSLSGSAPAAAAAGPSNDFLNKVMGGYTAGSRLDERKADVIRKMWQASGGKLTANDVYRNQDYIRASARGVKSAAAMEIDDLSQLSSLLAGQTKNASGIGKAISGIWNKGIGASAADWWLRRGVRGAAAQHRAASDALSAAINAPGHGLPMQQIDDKLSALAKRDDLIAKLKQFRADPAAAASANAKANTILGVGGAVGAGALGHGMGERSGRRAGAEAGFDAGSLAGLQAAEANMDPGGVLGMFQGGINRAPASAQLASARDAILAGVLGQS